MNAHTNIPAEQVQGGGDYTTVQVEQRATLSGWHIGTILLGALIALPAFMMGSELGNGLGARGALIASLAGGLVVTLIALPGAIAGARSRLSSYMLIIETFGTLGGKCINVALSLSVLGWFGIISMMFGAAMKGAAGGALAHISPAVWALGGCVLMTITNLIGIKALDILSIFATPLKVCLLLGAAWAAFRMAHGELPALPGGTHYTVATGISIVVGGIAIGVVLLPDITRYARSSWHAAVSCALAIGVGFPAILVLSGYPSLVTHERDLVPIMLKLGLGAPAMAVILFSSWSTNTYNLYQSTLMWSSVVRQPRWRIALATGIVGTVSGLLGIGEQLMQYLLALSVAIPPVGGVYLIDFYLFSQTGVSRRAPRQWRWSAFIAWALGVGLAVLEGLVPFTLSTVPAIDSLVLSAIAYPLIQLLLKGRPGAVEQATLQ
ncbi:hypothetical protein PQR65_39350 [Paraburkholderia nemoris]|uniref:hypothetical protein n=1 Tax=Paraburkholderia nemoris TaxID=2793076 RepID=UPI0038B8FCFE